jgi:glycosyltransferase involved in cell wall biosynthesis
LHHQLRGSDGGLGFATGQIRTISLYDDVVVIDNGSTDGIVECAKAAGARVVQHKWRVMRFRDSPVHDTVDASADPVGQLLAAAFYHSARSYTHSQARRLRQPAGAHAKKSAWALWLRVPLEYPPTLPEVFHHKTVRRRFLQRFAVCRVTRSLARNYWNSLNMSQRLKSAHACYTGTS